MRKAQASILGTIGETPSVYLQRLRPTSGARVGVKLEFFGPTGSHNDHVALALVCEAERRGEIAPGMTLVDYTGGSTGAALAAICAVKGYRCRVVCSDAYSQEKIRSMRALGAEVELVPSRGRMIDRHLISTMMSRAREIGSRPGFHYLDMHGSHDPLQAGALIGEELLQQFADPIDAFCSGFGTAALLMGGARTFKAASPSTRVIALEPSASPIVSTGEAGRHRIEGLGYGFEPALFVREFVDETRTVDEATARATTRRLAAEEGIFVGASSGFNVAGAIELARNMDPGQLVLTVCCDSGFKYMSTDLFEEEQAPRI